MTTMNADFERSFACATWLMDRFAADHDLLRQYMGGSPDMLAAVGVIEREAREHGWARVDVEDALRRLQHS